MSGTLLAATKSSVTFLDCGASKADASVTAAPVNIEGVTCSAWSTEGDAYIGAENGSVQRWSKSSAALETMYASSGPVVALAVRDATTVVVGHADNVLLINSSTGSLIGSPIPVSSTLKSLTLSKDKELLAIATEGTIAVYNLLTNVSASLNPRHLPGPVECVVFLASKPTTLVAACGSQLIIFDTTKPNTPLKTITLPATCQVVDMGCLSSGRGYLAVATEEGAVYIIDIEKEKPISRKIEFKQKLSALTISADSSAIIVGTANGQILIQDIRGSDRAIRAIPTGCHNTVLALDIQKKSLSTRTAPMRAASNVATSRAQPLGDRNTQRAVSTGRITRKVSTESEGPLKETARPKPNVRVATSPVIARRPLKKETPALSDIENVASPQDVLSNVTRRRVTSAREKNPVVANNIARRTSGATSSAATSPVSVHSRPRSRVSFELMSPANEKTAHRVSSTLSKTTTNRTPSPDLPVVDDISTAFQGQYEIPPIKAAQEEDDDDDEATTGLTPVAVIDLSDSPAAKEKDPWLAAAKMGIIKANHSGMRTPTRNESTPPLTRVTNAHKMELVPSTPPRRATLPANKRALGSGMMQVSPMRSPAQVGTPPNVVHAQELIRTVVREALTERDEEHREELRAMHLDLVKMSRTMKNELRAMMEEYVGDFKSLREENQKLRAENERLRRGY